MPESERLQEEIFPLNWEGWDEQDVHRKQKNKESQQYV